MVYSLEKYFIQINSSCLWVRNKMGNFPMGSFQQNGKIFFNISFLNLASMQMVNGKTNILETSLKIFQHLFRDTIMFVGVWSLLNGLNNEVVLMLHLLLFSIKNKHFQHSMHPSTLKVTDILFSVNAQNLMIVRRAYMKNKGKSPVACDFYL